MLRVLAPIGLLLLVAAWLLLRDGVLTSTVPGPGVQPGATASPTLAERLDRAGDLVVPGTGREPAPSAAGEGHGED
jgi:hypothetical protein